MKKSKIEDIHTDTSTKEMIVKRSIEIINSIGMVDFRIDNLSGDLLLSPGNITYHFSKKEELLNTLWTEFYNKFETVDLLLTKIIDIKQFFLFFKSIADIIYRYRGVVMFRGGDVKFLEIDSSNEKSFVLLINKKTTIIMDQLAVNGFFDKEYVNKDREIIQAIASNTLIHWVNREILFGNSESFKNRINDNALLVLYAFSSMFTVKGKMQYEELKKIVANNEIDF